MRQIKFMYTVETESGDTHGRSFDLQEVEDGLLHGWFDEITSPIVDFYRRQFTGLHDKNGKEIYEGDIVLLKNEVSRGDGQYDDAIFKVKYDKDYTAFMGVSDLCDEYLGHLEPDEVIGNIHENPELL